LIDWSTHRQSLENNMSQFATALDGSIDALLPEMEGIYQDLHRHPELSMQEVRTAGIAADYLAAHGFEVTRGEEVGRGARNMMDDGMAERFPKPDVILGQHVMVGEAGTVGYRSGTILSAGDSMKIQLFGRGAHGSMPQTSIDPVVMAASTVLRLQTIVSREIGPLDSAVVTVGALQAGTKENIIPDDATLKLNIRTYDEGGREHVLSAVRRICCAECAASNAPRDPEFTALNSYPLTENDAATTARVAAAFRALLGERAYETAPASASEDFSVFGRRWGVPYVFWIVGGTDAQTYREAKAKRQINAIPANHSPLYAPTLHPTPKTGLQAMLTAASAWLFVDPDAA
jgi:metal-dependent amidase/aminoacylase/carboxypeptidase family protein